VDSNGFGFRIGRLAHRARDFFSNAVSEPSMLAVCADSRILRPLAPA
jgi:hypothetical protein